MNTFDVHFYQRFLIKISNQRKGQLEVYYKLKLMIIRWSLISVQAQCPQFVSDDSPLIKKTLLFIAVKLSGYERFLRFKRSILAPCVKTVYITFFSAEKIARMNKDIIFE